MPNRMFVAGEWTDGTAAGVIKVTSPVTGEELAEVPISGPEDVDGAVRAARAGAEQLDRMTPFDRAALLHRAASLIRERKEALASSLASRGSPTTPRGSTRSRRRPRTSRWPRRT